MARPRSTWELQAVIPVLYTHQKVARRPIRREGLLRLNAGRAVLCDASGRKLDEETVTTALIEQLKSGEEIDFPGHLLEPDPSDAAQRQLMHQREPPTMRDRMQTLGRRGGRPTGELPKQFKRPRLAEVKEAEKADTDIREPSEPEKNGGKQATPTPCRQREFQGAATRFRVPRLHSSWEQVFGEQQWQEEAHSEWVQCKKPIEQLDEAPVEEDRCVAEAVTTSPAWQHVEHQGLWVQEEKEVPADQECLPKMQPILQSQEDRCVAEAVTTSPAWQHVEHQGLRVQEEKEVPADQECLQKEALFQHQQQTIEEALAWEQHYLGSSGTLASNESEEEDLTGMTEETEEDGEDDLPLLAVLGQAAPASKSQGQKSSSHAVIQLPLTFGKCNVGTYPDRPLASKALYIEYFEHALVSEMQHRLSSWAAETGHSLLHLRLGPAKDDPRLAALIFDRVPGDLSSGKNDLWVVLGVHGEPLLLRSLWKGVTPKGRLLCAPVNTAAIQWLQNNSRLSRATALCSGSFSSELVQVETLRQCTETLLALLGEASPNLSLPFETPELPLPLNDQQSEVVRHVAAWAGGEGEEWGGRVLVQGVFGSGKSCTLAACIMVLDRLLEAQKDTRRILLLCQTNVAVDRVLRCLLSLGWDNFVRLGNFRAMHPAVLHRAAGLRPARATQDFIDALMQHEQVGDLAIRDKLAVLRTAASNGELPIRPSEWKRRRLVATTAAALESADHLGLAAPFCFVDEASQLTEPSLVHAFIRAQAKFALLLGDTKQLPPRAVHPPLQRSALVPSISRKSLQ
ncbi:Protein ZGRF1 (GRF-type zinc finger domain-containing protein 1) [Durusdinium trenchii]|uniref:Protein ZGRF1 (GRF-type zinc finger domain-containing protein 1) n=1 Tax=Durusdinium trenchii TaxID=1381693 RepID=A0ABP0NYX6_9DINO